VEPFSFSLSPQLTSMIWMWVFCLLDILETCPLPVTLNKKSSFRIHSHYEQFLSRKKKHFFLE
jgi:hypothetical protein